MSETIILDPTEVSSFRSELNINSGAIQITQDGIDWGDAAIAAYMAEQERGESPVDYRVPNRQISMTLKLQSAGAVTFAQARAKLQAKISLIQQEGGWLKRITSGGGVYYMDLVNATLNIPDSWLGVNRSIEPAVVLSLEAIPDFYGDEVAGTTHSTTTLNELVWTETGIVGNYPGRCRLLINNGQATDQRGVIWSFRSRNYSNAATAAPAYASTALELLDTAFISSGTVVHSDASTDWTPVLGTRLAGVTNLTHVGTYRVFARVQSFGRDVQFRFLWDVGDMALPTENEPVTIPGTNQAYALDMGEVRLHRAAGGLPHRWIGQFQVKGAVGGETTLFARVWFVNVDESMGILSAPVEAKSSLSQFSARDEFNQSAGNLTGKVMPIGGTWGANSLGAAPTDYFVETTNHVATRITLPVTDPYPRAALAQPSVSAVSVSLDISWSPSPVELCEQAVVCRYVDPSNFLAFARSLTATGGTPYTTTGQIEVYKVVAGVRTSLGIVRSPYISPALVWFTLRLDVDALGNWVAYFTAAGVPTPATPLMSGTEDVLKAGGVLSTGRGGMLDGNNKQGILRAYNNFRMTTPVPDAAIFASRSAQVTTDGIVRQDKLGQSYAPVGRNVGDVPRVPPAGLENRSLEVFVKTSRGEFNLLPDLGTDDVSARLYYRPSWIQAPET